jgi:replicative DNA helicase
MKALELSRNGQPVHVGSVALALEAQFSGSFDRFFIEMLDSFTISSAWEWYFTTLKDKAALRAIILESNRLQSHAMDKTACGAELIEAAQKTFNNLATPNVGDNLLPACVSSMDAKLDFMASGKKVLGLETPFSFWNTIFGGLVQGGLYAVAGRPGSGKTAMAEQMIAHFIGQDMPVLVVERDMSPQTLVERISCREAQIPYWKYVRGMLNQAEIEQLRLFAREVGKTHLRLYSPSGLTPEGFCAILRREKRQSGIVACFLDHIQALNVGKELREGLTRASLEIRQTVTDTGVPTVVLAHLNRNGGRQKPTPEDIKEFDQLYGDCDGMALLWSEQKREELAPGELLPVKFTTAKNRAGPLPEEDTLFNGAAMSFLPHAVKK